MVLILWLYYSTVILFYGAEWAQVRARLLGNRLEPAPHANRLVVEARDADDPKAESKIAEKSAWPAKVRTGQRDSALSTLYRKRRTICSRKEGFRRARLSIRGESSLRGRF